MERHMLRLSGWWISPVSFRSQVECLFWDLYVVRAANFTCNLYGWILIMCVIVIVYLLSANKTLTKYQSQHWTLSLVRLHRYKISWHWFCPPHCLQHCCVGRNVVNLRVVRNQYILTVGPVFFRSLNLFVYDIHCGNSPVVFQSSIQFSYHSLWCLYMFYSILHSLYSAHGEGLVLYCFQSMLMLADTVFKVVVKLVGVTQVSQNLDFPLHTEFLTTLNRIFRSGSSNWVKHFLKLT